MRKITTIFLALFISMLGFAQDVIIEDVNGREFKGVKALIDPTTNEAKGYYTFYRLEKKGKGIATFNLGLYDNDLKLIKNVTYDVNKFTIISSSVFNGKDFMFIFDEPGKSMKYATVSMTGEKIADKAMEAQKRWFASTMVYPAEGGFFIVDALKEKDEEGKRLGYKIAKVDNKLNQIWEAKYAPESGMNYVENIKSVNDKLYVIHGESAKVVFSMNAKMKVDKSLKCINSTDGKEMFSYKLFDGTHTTEPTSYFLEENGNVALGGMFFEGQKQSSKNSDGVFFTLLDAKGTQLSSAKYPWDGELQGLMKKSKKGFKIGGKPKAYFHKIVKSNDGKYQIISELFMKSVRVVPGGTAGTAMKVGMAASGRMIGSFSNENGEFLTTLEVMDLMIFEFDAKAALTGVNVVEKEHTKVFLGEPYTGMTGLAVADVVNDFGFFNYKFTYNNGTEEFMVLSNFTKKDPHIGFVKMDGVMSADENYPRIPFKFQPKKGRLMVSKGSNNRVMISAYDKKADQIWMYLDNIKLK